MTDRIYACEEATADGLAGFGERLRMEVLDMLGYDDGPALYITVALPDGDAADPIEVVLDGATARRMLRTCLDALDREASR